MSVRRLRQSIGWGTKHVLAVAFAALSTAPLAAQDSPTQANGPAVTEVEAPEAIDEVIVRGRRLSEIEADLRIHIDAFLDEVAAPMRDRGYARWNREVCVGVHNLEQTSAQYVVDRVSSLALEVGLEPGEPGCSPHVHIIFTTSAGELTARMVEDQPRLFQLGAGFADTNLGREALDAFVKSDRPVRWWHVSLPVDARTGNTAIELPGMPRSCNLSGGGMRCGAPTINVAGPSRIHSGIVDTLQYVIIVVDGTKLAGKTTWQQLADYLAVVSLAQIKPGTDPTAFDSILNLFSNPNAYSGLTDWDRSDIRALYAFDQERLPQMQRNDIVGRIANRELGLTE